MGTPSGFSAFFLSRLNESSGRAIVITLASASGLDILKLFEDIHV